MTKEKFAGESNESVESVDLGVAIGLEGEALGESYRLAGIIAEKVSTEFVLGDTAVPHITLFQGRFPLSTLNAINSLFKELSLEDFSELSMEEKLFIRPNGNIFWNVKPDESLAGFYLFLTDSMMPLTDGLVMEQFQKILNDPNASDNDKEYIRKYGTVLSGNRFLPHVTIGRLKNYSDASLLDDVTIKPMSFLPRHLILGELGQYGEVKNVKKSNI